jgi:hypothetical protein
MTGEILSVPFAAAALVLCVAGVAKLRSPHPASGALASLGLAAGPGPVRVLGALEVALGCSGLIAPGALVAVPMAAAYAVFALVARLLVSRRASCGCFGESEVPASTGQSVLSVVLATVCVLAAVRVPASLLWMLARPVGLSAALVLALAGCAYAIVVAYTLLPSAWAAWSPR